jgi:hypothetical protein
MAKRKPRRKSTPKTLKVKDAPPQAIAAESAPLPADLPRVKGELTNCPKCKSTERTAYQKTREPLIWNGGRTTWNRTQCKKCGQYRIDRHTHSV